MNEEKLAQIKAHSREIAQLLYEETDSEKLTTLEDIEETVRDYWLDYMGPEVGFFLSKRAAAKVVVEKEALTALLAN